MRVVLSTCPVDQATRLARALLEERLVACVNVVPRVESHYWWEGKITTDAEALLVMKTRAEAVDALVVRLRALHPYEVPEIVALEIVAGNAQYLEWIASTVPRTPS
jgi:periplasmic divalent cation tolerance protein